MHQRLKTPRPVPCISSSTGGSLTITGFFPIFPSEVEEEVLIFLQISILLLLLLFVVVIFSSSGPVSSSSSIRGNDVACAS